ncbi:MFS transporter [Oscillatoria sp. FACHB-1406]|uniref:MFS transporter n=1 Tax=Oscillatoria sp. FACHB-1406 TaxID=2692846 RepID=UPI0016832441|nr:MFS transporter [Oscillatoria sp. FACHB-1406]MBD2578174.1 MFS transporter [Oscillatoria sp. FACHB-1406]
MTAMPRLLECLKNPQFARLYLAQTINLVGDAFTWLGLALLAFEVGGGKAAAILSGALTLRVMAFAILSPVAGAIADRCDRKQMMILTHILRAIAVCLFPFVTQIWHIYALVLALNVVGAFFTPTYTATIPFVTGKDDYPNAIALSSTTYQLLGVLGPGLAGSVAAFVGTRSVFFIDGLTFLSAAFLLLTLPGKLAVIQPQDERRTIGKMFKDLGLGTNCLFSDPPIRYALFVQLVAAISGAQILVNTVSYVRGTLNLGKVEYGWVMAAFGIGATIASVGLGNLDRSYRKTKFVGIGIILLTLALLPANVANLGGLLVLWAIAGIGQTLVNLPTQTLIADRVAVEIQGRVYGAHFAWSHLWWAFSYPLAGWMGSHFPAQSFFYSSLISAVLLILVRFAFNPTRGRMANNGLWHEHEHIHDEHHAHHRSTNGTIPTHRHLHFHPELTS